MKYGCLFLLATSVSLFIYLTEPVWNWERRARPSGISINNVVSSPGINGVLDGNYCAIYELSADFSKKVVDNGVRYLQENVFLTSELYGEKGPWIKSPADIDVEHSQITIYKESHRPHLLNIGALYASGICNRNENIRIEKLLADLRMPGSYYMLWHGGAGVLIIEPKARLALFLFSQS
jgi:hypothetical protein